MEVIDEKLLPSMKEDRSLMMLKKSAGRPEGFTVIFPATRVVKTFSLGGKPPNIFVHIPLSAAADRRM